MKIYSSVLILSVIGLLLSGCGRCPEPEIVTIYEPVYKTKIVKIPVKCDVPKPKCDFKGKGYEPAVKLLECVVTQKKFIDTCFKKNKNKETK